MTSVRDAVAVRDEQQSKSSTALVPSYRDEFELVLPSHINPDSFVQMAVAALRKSPDLKEAADTDPASLIYALRDAARLGLQPGTEQYWLTPRRVKGQPTVLGIVGYEGEVELMYRAGAVQAVIVEAVHDGDTFSYVPGRDDRPVHEIDWFGDRGKPKGAYAYAIMRGGAVSKVCVAGKARIDRAKAASPTADKSFSPWKSDEAAMMMKTAAHDLAKWVPTSAEYLREQLRAVADVKAEPPREVQQIPDYGVDVEDNGPFVDDDGVVVDGEYEPSWPETAQPA